MKAVVVIIFLLLVIFEYDIIVILDITGFVIVIA